MHDFKNSIYFNELLYLSILNIFTILVKHWKSWKIQIEMIMFS